jgi:DnaJ-class molecular chaperone
MSVADEDLYELFELDQSAGDREIALAFRRLAKRWHPDLNSTHEATERMQHISAAYEVLRDPDRRAAYDRALCPEPLASATTAVSRLLLAGAGARRRGDHREARRLVTVAARLCQEVIGLWPISARSVHH